MKHHILIIILCLFISSCMKNMPAEDAFDHAKLFSSYTFDDSIPIGERIYDIPDFLLNYWKEFDQIESYSSYTPTQKERTLINETLKRIPPLNKTILEQRLIGIYFMNNFLGSGAADWVIDKKDNTLYFVIILNPIVLKKDFSELVTWKEQTCFKQDSNDIQITVECGTKYSGLLYILVHETTHIVDYALAITPYTEPSMKDFPNMIIDESLFIKKIWNDYDQTIEDYTFRDEVTFYGFGGGPKMNISSAVPVYQELYRSPFVSLYGSLNWAEDLAEFVTFYHITQKLNEPYSITVKNKGKMVYTLKPMESEKVKSRFEHMEIFYQ